MTPAYYKFAVVCLALSGCGGGSGGQQAIFEASPIRVFSDDSGVGKLSIASGGENATGYLLAPEIALAIDELRATNSIEPVDTAGIAEVGSGPNTVIREGAVSEDGIALNVLSVDTNDGDASVVLFEEPVSGDTLLFTGGDIATALPVSGTATYSGVWGMQNLVFDSAPELGTFTAEVEFGGTAPSLEFNGSTSNYDVNATAPVTGNSFSSANVSILDSAEALPISGRINGDFHGAGGNSMAGVIYSNDSFGNYRGGFVGSK